MDRMSGKKGRRRQGSPGAGRRRTEAGAGRSEVVRHGLGLQGSKHRAVVLNLGCTLMPPRSFPHTPSHAWDSGFLGVTD